MNSLMAMVGGILAATFFSNKDPGFVHNGPLAGLVAICAGSDVVNPLGALVIGLVAGLLFVKAFSWTQKNLKVDDVLGVWPLHGLCGIWGALAAVCFRFNGAWWTGWRVVCIAGCRYLDRRRDCVCRGLSGVFHCESDFHFAYGR